MCLCFSRRINSQKSNIIYERLLKIFFSWEVDVCIMYLFGKKDFLKKAFKITGKGTTVFISLCDFGKYRNVDMILIEVI